MNSIDSFTDFTLKFFDRRIAAERKILETPMIKVDRCFEHRIHRDFIADCSLCQLAKDDLRSDYEFDRMKELEESES